MIRPRVHRAVTAVRGDWNSIATAPGTATDSGLSSRVMWPCCGVCSPAKTRARVVLPLPDAPVSPVMLPAAMVRLTSVSTGSPP